MNIPPSTTGSTPAGNATWPVVARLPDVADQLPAASQRSTRAAAAGFVDYRFDPPAGVGDDPARARYSVQPHVFQRPSRTNDRAHVPGSRSPILPRSNPFSIPASSLQDRLAPVVRFLVLFMLITAAGTTFLTSGRRAQPSSEPGRPRPRSIAPATTAAQQSLEPAANTIQPPIVAPTAAGPLGAIPKPAIRNPPFAIETAITEPRLAGANGAPLPQVQTSDPEAIGVADDRARPPAMARLPGYIRPVPSLQAPHDDNQSSLH